MIDYTQLIKDLPYDPYYMVMNMRDNGIEEKMIYTFLLCSSRYGARAHLAREMGLKKGRGRRWPIAAATNRIINGIQFDLYVNDEGSRKHRLYVKCPKCSKQVPVGRFHQHAPTHYHWL